MIVRVEPSTQCEAIGTCAGLTGLRDGAALSDFRRCSPIPAPGFPNLQKETTTGRICASSSPCTRGPFVCLCRGAWSILSRSTRHRW